MFDNWYEPDPPIMIGSAHAVAGESIPVSHKAIGFVWPKPNPKDIVLPTVDEILKFSQSEAE